MESITIQPFDWTSKDDIGNQQIEIHCWGWDRNSNPVLIRYLEFQASMYIILPESNTQGYKLNWNMETGKKVIDRLSRFNINSYEFTERYPLYFYQHSKSKMLLLRFNSKRDMKKCSYYVNSSKFNFVEYGEFQVRACEFNISIVRKLLTQLQMKLCQWYSITAERIESAENNENYNVTRISNVKNEYIGLIRDIIVIPFEETGDWNVYPSILAFDIECYSDNHRAMPDPLNSLHVAYMISAIYQRYKKPETRKRYGIIIGECNPIEPGPNGEEYNIIQVRNESELMQAYAWIVNECDPDIFTGYNIFGFDYDYLNSRITRLLNSWPNLSRMINYKSEIKNKELNSAGYGANSFSILKTEGRISIDVLPIIRSTNKLDKYDLNTVSKKFIGKTKHDIKAPEMFRYYEDMHRERNQYLQFQNNREKYSEAIENMTRVMKYCIQDSELVLDLIDQMNIWVSQSEMANIVGLKPSKLATTGQQKKCVSQLYDLAHVSGYVLNRVPRTRIPYSGGYVFDPIKGLHDNIICLDFASLYPSIIMAYNICYTSLIDVNDQLTDENDCNVIEFDQVEVIKTEIINPDPNAIGKRKKYKKTENTNHYRFCFRKNVRNDDGILPKLVRNLVRERRAVNAKIRQVGSQLKITEEYENIRNMLNDYLNSKFKYSDRTIIESEIEQAVKNKDDRLISQLKSNIKFNDFISGINDINDSGIKNLQNEIINNYPNNIRVIFDKLESDRKSRLSEIESQKLLLIVLDKRQGALKISANSFYGFLGVQEGSGLSLIEGAMSITAKGRQLINFVSDFINEKYGGIQVAGDTDSTMVKMPQITSPDQCDYWGKKLVNDINGVKKGEKNADGIIMECDVPGLFPPPLSMEFEKAMRILCLKKKKYSALFINAKGEFVTEDEKDNQGNVIGKKLKVLSKGIILARRDYSPLVNEIYTKIMLLILKKEPFSKSFYELVMYITSFLNGYIGYEKMVIIKGFGYNYKTDVATMKVFAENIRRKGIDVKPGDRLEYVVIKNDSLKLLGDRMTLLEHYEYAESVGQPLTIDYQYYLERQLNNPINQLFQTGYIDIIQNLMNIKYITSKRKIIYINEPVKLLGAIYSEQGIETMCEYALIIYQELLRKESEF